MPKISSPLGNKNIPLRPFREIDIPDESDYKEFPMEDGEPVVRKRHANNIDLDAARAYQAQMQRQEIPIYEKDPTQLENEIRQAKNDRRLGIERLNDGAKRRIEILIGMTRTTREINIDNNSFVLQSLKSKEMREAITTAAEFDNTVQSPFEIRRQLLARSLIQVAGMDISQFVGSNSLEANLQFIDEIDNALLNRLYNEYLILDKESRQKYSIKSDEEVKEVVEDLKK